MKVQLIVVRGKPEGKVIPLAGPKFKIGRGETCHLRPNSEQVSREHAEFTLEARHRDRSRPGQPQRNPGQRQGIDHRVVQAQGSRPGPGGTAHLRRLDPGCTGARVQASRRPPPRRPPPSPSPRPTTSPPTTSIPGCWAKTPPARPTSPQRSTAETRSPSPPSRTPRPAPPAAAKPAPAPRLAVPADKPPSVASDEEYERQSEDEEEQEEAIGDEPIEDERTSKTRTRRPRRSPEEEFMDESNPFYAAKKAQKDQAKKAGTRGRDLKRRSSKTAATRPTISFAS